MNWRLFTADDKAENKIQRYRRHARRQREKRRDAKHRDIASMVAISAMALGEITSEQSRDLKFSHWNGNLSTVRQLRRLEEIMVGWAPVSMPEDGTEEFLRPDRPARILQRHGRGRPWADAFNNQMEIAREEYAAGVALGQMPRAAGDWALFTHRKLEELLDGVVIPHRLRRGEYLILLQPGEPRCLDLHSRTYKPLCRIPFA
jgi:hypothetical protein